MSNRSSRPLTVTIKAYTLNVGCDVTGQLFGVSGYQQSPQPQTLVSKKVGDATGSGTSISVTPNGPGGVSTVTIAPFTTTALATLPETSTAEVGLPVAAGSTTVLTSNSNITNSNQQTTNLSFTYSTTSGGSLYGVACFPAKPNGQLAQALQNVLIIGSPKFYCTFDPGGSAITFGQVVNFAISNLDPDIGFIELDGPPIISTCSDGTGKSCPTGQFTISPASTDVQNVVVGNIADIKACIAAGGDTSNCNNGAAAATSVSGVQQRELIVADDPTYKVTPAYGFTAGFKLTIPQTTPKSTCYLDQGSDDNSDEPSGYSDPAAGAGSTTTASNFPNLGPNVAFDIDFTGATGTCTVDITEMNAPKRTFVYTIATH